MLSGSTINRQAERTSAAADEETLPRAYDRSASPPRGVPRQSGPIPSTVGHSILAGWLHSRPAVRGAAVAILAALATTMTLRGFERVVPNIDGWAIYWPCNGIAAAALLMLERRLWFWVIVGFSAALGRNEVVAGERWTEITVDVASNVAEVLIAAFALPPFRSLKQWIMERNVVTRFAAFAIVAGPASLSVPVALYFNHGYHAGFAQQAIRWGFADALGAALWMPTVLVLFSRETYDLFRWRALAETLALLGGLYAVTWASFHQTSYPISFIPYPFLLLVALRLGFSGAVIGVNMLSIISAHLSLHGYGPFLTRGAWGEPQTVILQLYSTLGMLFVLPLSVTLVERRDFEQQLQQAYADMKQLASEDKLTGVANRRRFDQVLEIEWKRAARNQTAIALLMIDADCFKAYNDRYGHLAGDECLRQIAAALASEPMRPQDLVARYGGEEFAILLPEAIISAAGEIAESVRLRVAETNIPHEGNPHGRVTISIGCAVIDADLETEPQALIAAADAALYTAKQGGRNRVHRSLASTMDAELEQIASH